MKRLPGERWQRGVMQIFTNCWGAGPGPACGPAFGPGPTHRAGNGNGKSIPKRPLLTAVDARGECLLNLQILLISIFCKLLLRATIGG